MQGLEYYIRSNTKLELVIHEMIDLVSRIENIHSQYEEYVTHFDDIERETLENFARGVIDDSALSVKGMLPRIQSLVGGPSGNEFRVLGNRGLLELIANDMKVSVNNLSDDNHNIDAFHISTRTDNVITSNINAISFKRLSI